MKRNNFWNETLLRRLSKGKKTAAQIESEEQRSRLRESISALQRQWAEQDAAETRNNESTQTMDTKTKQKLRQLVHNELRENFWGNYDLFEKALANVVRAHPEFANVKNELATEFSNAQASKPTPRALRAEVLAMVKTTGLDYDAAFLTVSEKYPALRNAVAFHNEEMQDSRAAGRELQEALDRFFSEHPGLDRKKQRDYERGFNAVCQAHPELVQRLHRPARSPINMWVARTSDGRTPAKELPATDRPTTHSPAERAGVA